MLDGLVTETAALRKQKYTMDLEDSWKDSLLIGFSTNMKKLMSPLAIASTPSRIMPIRASCAVVEANTIASSGRRKHTLSRK